MTSGDVPKVRWLDLPPAARDWVVTEQMAVWIPPEPNAADEANLRRVLRDWEALAGRLLREAMFGDENARAMRKLAEAVAAAAEALCVAVDGPRAT